MSLKWVPKLSSEKVDPNRCDASVIISGMWNPSQCRRLWKLETTINGEPRRVCAIHAKPERRGPTKFERRAIEDRIFRRWQGALGEILGLTNHDFFNKAKRIARAALDYDGREEPTK